MKTSELINLLTERIFDVVKPEGKKHVFFSGYNLYQALLLIHLASDGTSEKEIIKSILNDDSNDKLDLKSLREELHSSFLSFYKSMNALNGTTQILANSSIWISKSFEIEDSYLKESKKYHNTEPQQVDFDDSKKTTLLINQWISNTTHELIPNALDSVNSEEKAILVNVLYFKGIWKNQFSKDSTRSATFYSHNLKEKKVDFMYKKDSYRFMIESDFTALCIPYDDGLSSMVIVMPSTETFDKMRDYKSGMFDEIVFPLLKQDAKSAEVYMPKFNLDDNLSGVDIFKQLGIEEIFTSKANLSRLNKSLFVSSIDHITKIEVDESGTKAAAVTITKMRVLSVSIKKDPIIKINNPFYFFIISGPEKEKVILFSGVVNEL